MKQDLDSRRRANLQRLFEPASVAILGASEIRTKPGGRPLAYLSEAGFAGRVYPINPRHETLFGYRCYPAIATLPEVPDLVVVAIPANSVLAAVHDAAAAGVGAMVIYTSGFAEIGPAGEAAEREIREIAARTGLIICGPNCQGIANLFNGLAVNFSTALSEGQPRPGPVGIVSQSGLVGALVTSECMARGLGIGYLVSTGNEAGFECADAIVHMAEDDRIRVIAGYVEGIRDAGRFREAAERARDRGKPLVILKAGRSPDAARAAASHTGSLAGPSHLFDALCAELGVVQAESLEDLADAAATFAHGVPLPAGPRVGIVGNSGGFNVICTDGLHRFGLSLAPFSAETVAAIARVIPSYLVAQNPVDLATLPMTDLVTTRSLLERMVADTMVDIIICCFGAIRAKVEELTAMLAEFARSAEKPLLVAWLASAPAGATSLAVGGVPTFSDPSRAVKAARRLLHAPRAGAAIGLAVRQSVTEAALAPLAARLRDMAACHQTIAGEAVLLPLLAEAGLKVPRMVQVASPKEAQAAFASLGAVSVAVKVDSDEFPHKTEIGGVRLGITSAEACRDACHMVLENASHNAPAAVLRGALIAEMIADGVEMIIGVKRDPVLGPFVAVGFGGIFVEVLQDVVLRPAPLDAVAALRMLRELKAFPLLDGARGKARKDIAALARAIATVSEIAAAVPQIVEMDLNPVFLRDEGQGLVVADALLRIADGAWPAAPAVPRHPV
ncbi:acetate--CoA ligase family protein [Siccirubricoccus sp. G192]|uniref:acetate--CoA ligase family protein n=1 Tax=Siccirubricoccus sp. G192 TaxID=2849651 RepID=UPI001C2BD660|nr:acetate--CoA ligase family protein [Siccirubricoccus sp. G192]MBV1795714.1 acetate--CoA ligase family protein [Siccirubricoccus sp. G192]